MIFSVATHGPWPPASGTRVGLAPPGRSRRFTRWRKCTGGAGGVRPPDPRVMRLTCRPLRRSARTSRCSRGCPAWTCPVIQSVMPFQNVPAPTAAGMWSEPSKRNDAAGSCSVSTDTRSIALERGPGRHPCWRSPSRRADGSLAAVGPVEPWTGRSGTPGPRDGRRTPRRTRHRRGSACWSRRRPAGRTRTRRRPRPIFAPPRASSSRVERRLAVHGARAGQDRQAGVLEGRRGDGLHVTEPAVDVVGVLHDRADLVEDRGDLRVVERDLVGDPLVVDLGAMQCAA